MDQVLAAERCHLLSNHPGGSAGQEREAVLQVAVREHDGADADRVHSHRRSRLPEVWPRLQAAPGWVRKTLSENCVNKFSQGLFITIHDKGHVLDVLKNWPEQVNIILVTSDTWDPQENIGHINYSLYIGREMTLPNPRTCALLWSLMVSAFLAWETSELRGWESRYLRKLLADLHLKRVRRSLTIGIRRWGSSPCTPRSPASLRTNFSPSPLMLEPTGRTKLHLQ